MWENARSGRVIIHADGRSCVEGASTWAFLARTRSGAQVHEASGPVENPYGDVTSLLAEWTATVEALRWFRNEKPAPAVTLRVDAALVAKALTDSRVVMKGYEGALAIEARDHLAALKGRGVRVRVQRVPRWRNADADELTQRAAEPEGPPVAREEGDGGLVPGVPPPSRRATRGTATR